MISVGIMAREQKWARTLEHLIREDDFSISGWINPVAQAQSDIDQLIDRSSLIWIPEKLNGDMTEAVQVLRKSKHLLLGFPVVDFVEEAFHLLKLTREAEVKVQVGHQERYLPAIRSIIPFLDHPQAVYVKHYTTLSGITETPPWFLQEMVSDLGLILPILQGPEKRVKVHVSLSRNHLPVTIDIRIEFHSGALAKLQYRPMTEKPKRTIEVIQPDDIIEIDLISETSVRQKLPLESGDRLPREILWEPPGNRSVGSLNNSLHFDDQITQCISFLQALKKDHQPVFPLEEGFHALEIARQIQSQIISY
ncbi:MAG: hypothetical protein J7L89_05690 [Bacteroidales bacterium]|nr:hypothetical protein [Bacteroidales bacterium]